MQDEFDTCSVRMCAAWIIGVQTPEEDADRIMEAVIAVDLWSLLAWRGLIGGAVILAHAIWREGARPLGRRGWLIPAFGLSFAAATVLLTEGAGRIPAAEVALLGGADVPLAVVFAMLILSEVPLTASWIGGAIIIAAAGVSAALGVRAKP